MCAFIEPLVPWSVTTLFPSDEVMTICNSATSVPVMNTISHRKTLPSVRFLSSPPLENGIPVMFMGITDTATNYVQSSIKCHADAQTP